MNLKRSYSYPPKFLGPLALLSLLIVLAGCQSRPELELVTYNDLPGWHQDEHLKALPALKESCQAISKRKNCSAMITKENGDGKACDWYHFCQGLKSKNFRSDQELRQYIEAHLEPYQLSASGNAEGTFTGYYEPILRGSLRRHGGYTTPLYTLPSAKVNYKVPRSKIVAGALKGKKLEIVWVDDPVDAFFLQIQGSGRVTLDTGRELRLGFAGQNGFPYTPIGKVMLDKGYLEPGKVNMHTIKKWLRAHPKQAESIMSQNQSYVFFKKMTGPGPIGSQGVPLTPERSMAVDRSYVSLGTPLWLAAAHPEAGQSPLNRLMVAQDTGGAIKGAVRGDYFWGTGNRAANLAGLMNSKGHLYVLLPR